MAHPELGIDMDWAEDMDPLCRLSEGLRQLVWDLIWRLRTERGALIDDEDYGTPIQSILHRGMTPSDVARAPERIAGELRKDERVSNGGTVNVQLERAGGDRWLVRVSGTSTLGPFEFVTDDTAVLLEAA